MVSARLIDAEDVIVDGKVVSTEYAAHQAHFINTPLGIAIIEDDGILVLKNQKAFQDPPLCVDIFAGCGGASLGLQLAGFKTIGIEMDKNAAATYQLNLGHNPRKANSAMPHSGDCIRADACHLPIRPYLEPDLVWASPPCQDYTQLNTGRNRDKFRDSPRAYLIVVAAIQIRALHPKTVIMENVPPAAKSWQWRWATELLQAGGYDVKTFLLDAANYGVPQYRYRAFMFASRVGPVGLPPRPTHGRDKDIMGGLNERFNTGAKRSAQSHIEVENMWMNWENEQPDLDSLDKMVRDLYDRLGFLPKDTERDGLGIPVVQEVAV